jgi:hypothetical protein
MRESLRKFRDVPREGKLQARRVRTSGLLLAFSLIQFVASPESVLSYGRDGLDLYVTPPFVACGPGTVFYRFMGEGWNATLEAAAVEGFNKWENVTDADGTQIVDLQRTADASKRPLIDVEFVEAPIDPQEEDSGTTGKCFQDPSGKTGLIQFATSARLSEPRLKSAAVHEMGHVLGLAHTAKNESIMEEPNASPTMTSLKCRPDKDAFRVERLTLSHDDHAGLVQREGLMSPKSMVRNESFEESFRPSWRQQYTDVERVNAASPRGNWYVKFTGNQPADGGHPRILQHVAVYKSQLLDGAVSVRRDAGVTGRAFIVLWSRVFDGSDCDIAPVGNWVLKIEESIPHSTTAGVPDGR